MRKRGYVRRFVAMGSVVALLSGSLSTAAFAADASEEAELVLDAQDDSFYEDSAGEDGTENVITDETTGEISQDTGEEEIAVEGALSDEELFAPEAQGDASLAEEDLSGIVFTDQVEEAQEEEEGQEEELSSEEEPDESDSGEEDDAIPGEDGEADSDQMEDAIPGTDAEALIPGSESENPAAEGEETPLSEEEFIELAGAESGTLADGKINWDVTTAGTVKTLRFTIVDPTKPAAIPDFPSAADCPWSDQAASITAVTIGDKVTAIGAMNFSGFAMLNQVTLPADGLTSIGAQAFANCSALKEITIPKSVTVFGNKAFLGDATLVFKGYFGSATEDFAAKNGLRFVPVDVTDLSGSVLTLSAKSYTYDGTEKKPNVTVKYSKVTLIKDVDYTIDYGDAVNAGNKTVTVTGKGYYKGIKKATYAINRRSIKSGKITGIKNMRYNGKAVTQDPKVVVNGRTLKKNKDYKLTYKNNTKQPSKYKKKYVTAYVTITGIGNYKDAVKKSFKIIMTKLYSSNVNALKDRTYTGKEIKPKPAVRVRGVKLKLGRDYTLSYKNNINVGTATVYVKGKGNYKGTAKKHFKIKKASIEDASISGITDKTYAAKSIKLDLTIKVGKRTLQEGTDYTVKYQDNFDAGTATVTIKGKANYRGKVVQQFEINKAKMKNTKITGLENKSYTGKPVTQTATVKLGDETLQENRDYTVSYKNNTEIGTATVIFTGIGSMEGAVAANFKIQLLKISDAKITGIEDKEYTGDSITQSITVKYKDKVLKKDVDYSLSYSNNVNVGDATVTITGMNGYSGSVTYKYHVLPKGAALSSVNLVVKRLTIKWQPQSGIDGYWLQYGTDKTFGTYLKNLVLKPERSEYIANVPTADTKYYVRIRTYKDVNGKRYYSYWRSNAK